jgi:hypothetical protein
MENPWTLPLRLLGVAVPLAHTGHYVIESVFARRGSIAEAA